MGKILDAEFRKELYKNLIEAGYDKTEAQKIVGKKYYVELHDSVKQDLNTVLDKIVKEDFSKTFDSETINKGIDELRKLQELLK